MRKLTLRERVLLALLAVVAVICAYVFLFHLPMEERAERLEGRILESQDLLAQTEAMITRQQEMETELDVLRTEDIRPMPDHDNIQNVMVELNAILAPSREYTLRFSSVQEENHVVARQVSLPFTCANYAAARSILQQLHDNDLRCLVDSVSITENEDGTVQVDATVIFYEYDGESGETPAES